MACCQFSASHYYLPKFTFWKVCWFEGLFVCLCGWKITHKSRMYWHIFTKFGTRMHQALVQNHIVFKVKSQRTRSWGQNKNISNYHPLWVQHAVNKCAPAGQLRGERGLTGPLSPASADSENLKPVGIRSKSVGGHPWSQPNKSAGTRHICIISNHQSNILVKM